MGNHCCVRRRCVITEGLAVDDVTYCCYPEEFHPLTGAVDERGRRLLWFCCGVYCRNLFLSKMDHEVYEDVPRCTCVNYSCCCREGWCRGPCCRQLCWRWPCIVCVNYYCCVFGQPPFEGGPPTEGCCLCVVDHRDELYSGPLKNIPNRF